MKAGIEVYDVKDEGIYNLRKMNKILNEFIVQNCSKGLRITLEERKEEHQICINEVKLRQVPRGLLYQLFYAVVTPKDMIKYYLHPAEKNDKDIQIN